MTPGLFPTKADYARESKQARKGDFRKLRIKTPTQHKSKPFWCRNCNKQLPLGKQFNPCPQCDHVNKQPLKRPMK